MTSVCTLPEGGSVTVGIGDSTRTFHAGDRLDLDAVAVPAAGARKAATWREVLGEHAAAFAPAEQPKRAAAAPEKG